jgi:hypothetical protein
LKNFHRNVSQIEVKLITTALASSCLAFHLMPCFQTEFKQPIQLITFFPASLKLGTQHPLKLKRDTHDIWLNAQSNNAKRK